MHYFEDEHARPRSGLDPEGIEFNFQAIAPAGFFVAVRVSFAFPAHVRNDLPVAWVNEYTREGLVLRDPTIKWIYANRGCARLSELDVGDPAGILARGAARGLRFGAAISYSAPTERSHLSYGQFYRSDCEFTDHELGILFARVRRLHRLAGPASAQISADLNRVAKPVVRASARVFPRLAG
jgi:LuxR family transcriptional regulator